MLIILLFCLVRLIYFSTSLKKKYTVSQVNKIFRLLMSKIQNKQKLLNNKNFNKPLFTFFYKKQYSSSEFVVTISILLKQ